MTEKVIRDGKVAVAVSKGFGAGWYSWNDPRKELIFDPLIIAAIEAGRLGDAADRAKELYPDAYTGGARGLVIVWVPVEAQFRIEEDDGYESLVLNDDGDWITA